MSLWVNKDSNYVNSYNTNLHYLDNMTELQLKALRTMLWSEENKYLHTGLKHIPGAWAYKKYTKISVEAFRNQLNNELKRL